MHNPAAASDIRRRAPQPGVVERRAASAFVRLYIERMPDWQHQTVQIMGLRASRLPDVAKRADERRVQLLAELRAAETAYCTELAAAPASISQNHVSIDILRAMRALIGMLSHDRFAHNE